MLFRIPEIQCLKFNNVPVLASWLEIYCLKGNTLNSIDDLNNLKLGVLSNSIQSDFVKNKLTKEMGLNIKLIEFESYKESISALLNKDIEAIIADRFFLFPG